MILSNRSYFPKISIEKKNICILSFCVLFGSCYGKMVKIACLCCCRFSFSLISFKLFLSVPFKAAAEMTIKIRPPFLKIDKLYHNSCHAVDNDNAAKIAHNFWNDIFQQNNRTVFFSLPFSVICYTFENYFHGIPLSPSFILLRMFVQPYAYICPR